MRRGFTIIELLVASLLLGMLMTILTMIFNQSSIAWRTGMAGTMDMEAARYGVSEVVEKSDNLFMYDNQTYHLISPWNTDSDELNARACSDEEYGKVTVAVPQDAGDAPKLEATVKNIGDSNKGVNYIVNVMSDGPNRKQGDYDDIWSVPDDFDD